MLVAFETLGCRLNQAETASLAGAFEQLGFEVTDDVESADVFIVHSCAVTLAAEQQGRRLLRRAQRLGRHRLVVFTGCAAEVTSTETLTADGAQLIVPQDQKDQLPQIVAARLGLAPTPLAGVPLPSFNKTRALVKVQDGCDFRCAYCIIPDTRGDPRSRPFDDIITEARTLADQGFREIILAGVNVATYNDRNRTLADLIRALAAIDRLQRIRLGSIEPATTEREIVDLCVAESKLCRTLHYPLQSGDAGILRAMRRRYNPAMFAATLDYALARVPQIGLGTDVITGFPGEDEAAFAATRSLIERYPFSNLHVFPYSERPGTPATELQESVPVHIRRERARELMTIGQAKRAAFAATWLDQTVSMIVERIDSDGTARGWTGEYLALQLADAPADAVGRLVSVKVAQVLDSQLFANWQDATIIDD